MSGSNCCFLTCIQVSREAGKVVCYSHLLKNFPQFAVIHIVKGFGIVNKAEVDVFLECSCFFYDPLYEAEAADPRTPRGSPPLTAVAPHPSWYAAQLDRAGAWPLLLGDRASLFTCLSGFLVFQVVRNLPTMQENCSIPGSARSPGEGNDNPLQYSCLETPMDRGSRRATVHGVAKSLTRLSTHTAQTRERQDLL